MSRARSSGESPRDVRTQHVMEEYLDRRRAGDVLCAQTILAKNPELRNELEDSFRALAVIEQNGEDALQTIPWPPSSDTPIAHGSSERTPDPACQGAERRFDVRSCLGAGGFGVVYLAYDSLLDRQVALKVPKPSRFPTLENRAQFLREARSSAKLRHPSIVAIYDVCEINDGLILVMEYIAGRNLRDLVDQGPMPAVDAVRLVERVADAIAYANQHGLIHRDLKPSNILLDREGQPHVADFGLAVQEEAMRLADRDLGGTPSYMAPEQVRGERGRLDGRTDLWSLGVLLYELLTGRRPFLGADREEVFYRILHQEPKPLRQIRPQIPPELERICLRCLEKSMADRYSTVADLVVALRSWREATEATLARKSRDSWRHGATVAAAALLVLASFGFWISSRDLGNTSEARPLGAAHLAAAAVGSTRPGISRNIPFAAIPAAQREPLRWYSLLEHPPLTLVWPGDLDRSPEPVHNANAQRLIAISRGEALLSFGELDGCDFIFEVEIHQTRWTGGVGIFLGGKVDKTNGEVRRFQRLYLQPVFAKDTGWHFAWIRSLVEAPPAGGGPKTTWDIFGSDRITALPPEPQTLRITVQKGRLHEVMWGGVRLPNVSRATREQLAADDHFGHFGLYLDQGECVFSDARIILASRR